MDFLLRYFSGEDAFCSDAFLSEKYIQYFGELSCAIIDAEKKRQIKKGIRNFLYIMISFSLNHDTDIQIQLSPPNSGVDVVSCEILLIFILI